MDQMFFAKVPGMASVSVSGLIHVECRRAEYAQAQHDLVPRGNMMPNDARVGGTLRQ